MSHDLGYIRLEPREKEILAWEAAQVPESGFRILPKPTAAERARQRLETK